MIGPHYFRGMPMPHLKRIVLGVKSRVTEGDVHRIRRSWQIRGEVEVSKAKIDPRTYRIRA